MRNFLFCCAVSLTIGAVLPAAFCTRAEAAEDDKAGKTSAKVKADHKSDRSKSEDHAGGGVPLDWERNLALWSGITFIIFVLVLRTFAWGPLSDGLNKREQNIRSDISAAEEARLKAEQMLAEHAKKLESVQDEVREILAEARRDAEHTKQDIVTHAQAEAEATKNRSITEIERARDVALKQLFDVMASHVADATEHVLARSMNEDDQKRLINDALAQFSEN